jgi:hypothetical protein
MPEPIGLVKAELWHIRWDDQHTPVPIKKVLDVQFNPESLKVGLSSQRAGGKQPAGGSVQYVGQSSATLAVELLFDVMAPDGCAAAGQPDVRRLTDKIAFFMRPTEKEAKDKRTPPGVEFRWGTFVFDGVMSSMNETLEYFSPDGRPLRASVSINLSQHSFTKYRFLPPKTPGTRAQLQVAAGQTIQDVVARNGNPETWRAAARKAGVENPRRPDPGTRVDSLQPA